MGLSGQTRLSFRTFSTEATCVPTAAHSVLGLLSCCDSIPCAVILKIQSFGFWFHVTGPLVVVVDFVELSLLIICLLLNASSVCGLGTCLAFGVVSGHSGGPLPFGFSALRSLILCGG